MTEAEKKYQVVTGEKPTGDVAQAVGLVWAIEHAGTLLERVRIARGDWSMMPEMR